MTQGNGLAVRSCVGVLALACMLTACGGGGNSASTPQGAIEQLESTGELPKLEREPSLAGIDVNGDGVRDDIEQYISRTYSEPAQRKAAMQMARVYQRMLSADTNAATAVESVVVASARAVDCVFDVFPGAQGSGVVRTLEALSTNTKTRLKAYLAFNMAASGSVSGSFKGHGCE